MTLRAAGAERCNLRTRTTLGTTGRNWLRGTALGHGVVPVDQCIRILKNAGYEGWLSLEFEGMEDCITAIEVGYRYLRKYA